MILIDLLESIMGIVHERKKCPQSLTYLCLSALPTARKKVLPLLSLRFSK